MRKVQVMKKKVNLTKVSCKKEILKKTKTQKKKMNLKLLMKRKRKNFQRHNGYIKFICLKYWMESTKKLL